MAELFAIEVPDDLASEVFERLLGVLNEESQSRIRRFRLQADKIRSLLGRISILWYLLSQSLISQTADVEFGIGEKGKPVIFEPRFSPEVEFNVSHDGGYVLLGVSRAGPIGVDVMRIPDTDDDGLSNLEEALTDQMTTREKQSFAVPLSDTDRAERLSTLWCIKEAYVKAKGEGIGFGLERIEVTLSADGVVEDVSVDGRQVRETGWKVDVGTVGEVYRWACLWQEGAGDTGLRVETITYKEVIDAIQS